MWLASAILRVSNIVYMNMASKSSQGAQWGRKPSATVSLKDPLTQMRQCLGRAPSPARAMPADDSDAADAGAEPPRTATDGGPADAGVSAWAAAAAVSAGDSGFTDDVCGVGDEGSRFGGG